MKFSKLEYCPFCGSEEVYEKRYARGPVWYQLRFDGKEADNTEMYEGLSFECSGRVYCNECNKYLGNIDKNIVSAAVAKKLGISNKKVVE